MRIKVIACKVLLRQLYQLAAQSPNTVDIAWMRQELHETPDKMRLALQAAIDAVEAEDERYDAIALGYGLCSNGTAGLTARKTPLVIARGHDCITLLLGDKQRYRTLFDGGKGGIYWFAQGWIENAQMPSKERYDALYKAYEEKYGEDNAAYLLEMEQTWMREYTQAIFVRWPAEGGHLAALDDDGERFTRRSAETFGWAYSCQHGDDALLRDLIGGAWDEARFLTVQPGQTVAASNDERIVIARDAS